MKKEELINLQLEKGQLEKGTGFGGFYTRLPQVMRGKLNLAMPAESIGKHPSMSFLSTIKSIYVTERLNDVFGVGGWDIETEVVSVDAMIHKVKGVDVEYTHVIVSGRIYFREFDLYGPVSYGGHDEKTLMAVNAFKGAVTDCLSKCASMLEIGLQVFKGNPMDRTPGSKSKRLDEHAPVKKAEPKKEAVKEEVTTTAGETADMGSDANAAGMAKPSVNESEEALVLEETPPAKTEAELAADAELAQLQSQHKFLFGKKANANVKIDNLRKKVQDEQAKRKAVEEAPVEEETTQDAKVVDESPFRDEVAEEVAAEVVKDLNHFKGIIDTYTSAAEIGKDAKKLLTECATAGLSGDEQKEFRQHCNAKYKSLS